MKATIYHNPRCGTSRTVLEVLENSGAEIDVIRYLETPPSREQLTSLIADMGISPRALLREKETAFSELNLSDEGLSDDALIDAMMDHPILIQRPIVVTAKGTKLCRPSEAVEDLL